MEFLREFANSDFLMLFGLVSVLFALFGALYTGYLVLAGILPVLYRLGKGLSNREIGIFAENEFSDLEDLLISSNLFKKNKIIQIRSSDLSKAEGKSVFLVSWKDFSNQIDAILTMKKRNTVLIVYSIDEMDRAKYKEIANTINASVVNSKGRLLNDILTSLMTTAYQK
jgi:hypothetical protein